MTSFVSGTWQWGRPVARLVLGCCAAVWLSGCAVRHEVAAAPAVAVPSTWSAALPPSVAAPTRAPADLAQWWTHFNDPWMVGLVQQALQANPDVRRAQAALQQSRAQRDVAAAALGPQVGATASVQRAQVGQAAAGSTFRAGFDASWEPDVFGVRRHAVAASESEVRAAQAAVAQAQVSLAAEVALRVIELRSLAQRQRLAQDNVARHRQTFALTQWRVQVGQASVLDLDQVEAALGQASAALPALQTSVDQSLHALAVLTGQAPGALLQGWSSESAVALPAPAAVLALSLPLDTLRQRPDVQAAQERVAAAWSHLASAQAQRYPDFTLTGSIGWGAAHWSDVFSPAAFSRSLLASLSAMVWDGGARQSQVQAQRAVLEQARIEHEAVVLAALREVEDALVALRGHHERLQGLERATLAVERSEWLARQRHASGLMDARSLLETQRGLIAAQNERVLAQTAWSVEHVRLYKALGGGWYPDGLGASAATVPPPPSQAAHTAR